MSKNGQNFFEGIGYLPTDIDHDYSFSLGTIKEAQAFGIRFGTLQFLIYDKLRWYENNGKMRTGIAVAGYRVYARCFGVTEKQIIDGFTKLRAKGAVELVLCDGDEKVFRNKTRVWVSTVRLKGILCAAEAVEFIKLGQRNQLPSMMLSHDMTLEETSTPVEETSTPVEGRMEKPPLSEVQMKYQGNTITGDKSPKIR